MESAEKLPPITSELELAEKLPPVTSELTGSLLY